MKETRRSYWRHRLSRSLQHSTPRRWNNHILAEAQYRLGLSQARGLPPLVHVDPINYCNLRCPLCPTGQGTLGRKRGRMPFDLFRILVDQIADSTYFLISTTGASHSCIPRSSIWWNTRRAKV